MGRVDSMVQWAVGIGLGILVLCLLTAWAVGSSTARPVRRMAQVMKALASGQLEVGVPATSRRDEIGEMARTVETFKQGLVENQRLQAEQQEMQQRASEDRSKARNELAASFEAEVSKSIGEMADTTQQMARSAEAMSGTAQDNVQRSGAVEHTAGQVSDNVQSVAAAVEELAASIREISQQVNSSSSVANSAADRARGAVDRVNALVSTAEQIGVLYTPPIWMGAQSSCLEMPPRYACNASRVGLSRNQGRRAALYSCAARCLIGRWTLPHSRARMPSVK